MSHKPDFHSKNYQSVKKRKDLRFLLCLIVKIRIATLNAIQTGNIVILQSLVKQTLGPTYSVVTLSCMLILFFHFLALTIVRWGTTNSKFSANTCALRNKN